MSDVIELVSKREADDRFLSDDVAVCLRKWLAMAENGELVGLVLVGETKAGDAICGKTAASMTYQTVGVLAAMKAELISDLAAK